MHFMAHVIEADPAITAYASHPKLVAMCEELIVGGEARIVECNARTNSGNKQGRGGVGTVTPFAPGWL